MFDILIKNGSVIDGIAKNAIKADVAIDNGKVVQIAPNISAKGGKKIIEAEGKFITPGFIDIQNHSDSYWTIFDQPDQLSLLSQGITSIVMGNCGSSLAPLPNQEAIKTIQKWHNLAGVNLNWASFEELCAILEQNKIGVNVASLVGHATLRRALVGDSVRNTTPDELKVMTKLLNESLDQGALGMSLGLVYSHEVDSTRLELEELARNLKHQDKYLSVHLRNEDSGILEALDEALEIAEKCEIAVKISHLKIRGKENWHLFDRVINKLENAYHQGLNVSFDAYPYSTSWSVLYTYLPRWAYEGGRPAILARITKDTERRKILDFLRQQNHNYDNIRIATAASNPTLIGKTLTQIAINQGISKEEALLAVLSASHGQAIVFDNNLSDEHVELILSSPLSIIASDGAGYTKESADLIHPRCFGTMPRFLSMVREKKILSWEQAIKKITSEPAKLMGLKARGILAPDAAADVVVFDPLTIQDLADYDQPYQMAKGINTVIVNGAIAFENGSVQTLAGKVIRR